MGMKGGIVSSDFTFLSFLTLVRLLGKCLSGMMCLPVICQNDILFGRSRTFLLTCLHYLQVLIHSNLLNQKICSFEL